MFNKNVGLMGGALGFFLLFAATEVASLGWTITGPLFQPQLSRVESAAGHAARRAFAAPGR